MIPRRRRISGDSALSRSCPGPQPNRHVRTAGRGSPSGRPRKALPVSIPSIPRGPGLFEITDDDGDRAITNIRKIAGGEVPPGRALVNTATILLGVRAAGLLAVSLAAQYRYIFHAKHDSWPAIIEAVALDAGMIIFSLLALGLARGGQTARIERALIVVCACGSAAMNYAGADVSSVRSVAAYVMPPVFLAIVTDRVIAVVRRHVLGMAAERSAWAALGRAALIAAAVAGKAVLYGLRLALAPRSTLGGARRWVLLATPLPAAPVSRPVLPSPSPVFLPPPSAIGGDEDQRSPIPMCLVKTGHAVGEICARPRPCTQHEPEVRLPGETKKAHLARLYADHPTFGNRAPASRTAAELAPHAQLSEGTARAYIYSFITPEEAS